jgi:protein SCO1/2
MSQPILGPRLGTQEITVNGKTRTDTIYHTIPAFNFTNWDGSPITEKTFNDKIYIANFFFASCQGICPKMQSGMKVVQDRCKDLTDIAFLSHTVNPENDTLPVLKEYAKRVTVGNTSNWYFVTGTKKDIYDIGIDGYLMPVGEDPRAEGGFLHSEQLVIIDKEKRIRGFFDGTDLAEVNKLIDALKIIYAEYAAKETIEMNKVTQGKKE